MHRASVALANDPHTPGPKLARGVSSRGGLCCSRFQRRSVEARLSILEAAALRLPRSATPFCREPEISLRGKYDNGRGLGLGSANSWIGWGKRIAVYRWVYPFQIGQNQPYQISAYREALRAGAPPSRPINARRGAAAERADSGLRHCLTLQATTPLSTKHPRARATPRERVAPFKGMGGSAHAPPQSRRTE
jgi:hypothetical protein